MSPGPAHVLTVHVASARYDPGLGGKAPPGVHGGPTVALKLALPPAEGITTEGTVRVDEPKKQVVITVAAHAAFAPELHTVHAVASAHRELVVRVNRPSAENARYTLLVKSGDGKELFRTVFVNTLPKG